MLVASERFQGRVIVAANKVSDEEDAARINAAFENTEVVLVPSDPVVNDADRRGLSPMDIDASSPAMVAIAGLSKQLHQ